ncbi:MAG: zinc ABC transporter substrate-binding protein [Prevotella sp.]|jgi:zinc transport system substrate-binding protein|nr:zinc ABC transporter substrate-binding protein [Prevotella sp.]
MSSKLLVSIILLIVVSLGGCKPNTRERAEVLTVTIEPQKYFLEKIVGNHYKVKAIIPAGSNPESADFTPSQMRDLSNSIIYFKIGYLGIENVLTDKMATEKPDLKIIDCSDGIMPVGDAHVHCNDETHDHKDEHQHGHIGGDPHTWSSVKSAKTIVENMYKALLETDNKNEADYTKNYNELIREINETDSIIRSYLDQSDSKAFIIYHPALSYFADEYGLMQYSIEYEGKNPSPSQLKELIDKAKAEKIKVVFIQEEFDTKNAETVAKEIGGKTIPINLLSYYWNEELIKIAKAITLGEI